MKKLTCILSLLFCCLSAQAQDIVMADDALISPNFFITIIAGVLLALAFQFVLTAISVAMGVSLVGNLKEKFVKANVNPSGNEVRDEYGSQKDEDSSGNMGVKVTSAIGIWSVLTSCIALFGATALALNISVFSSTAVDISVALTIWALFFLILFYLESKLINTVVGGLINTATSGLKASAGAVKNLFEPSDSSKIESTIESAITKIKSEFDSGFDTSEISGVVDNFFNKMDKKVPSYDKLKKDLKDIVEKSGDSNSGQTSMAIQQALNKAIDESADKDDQESKDKVTKLKELLKDTKNAYDNGDGKAEGVKKVIEKFTDQDKKDIDGKIETVKDYIIKATPEDFDKEKLNEDIEKIINDPKTISSVLSSEFKDFDDDKLIALLSKNTNLNKDELKGYSEKIQGAVKRVTEMFESDQSDSDKSLSQKAEGHVADYLNGTDKDELNYDDLKKDVLKIIDNPGDGLSIVKDRLAKFDTDTLKALITNNKYVKEDQVDQIVQSIEDAKTQVGDKVSKIETKAHQQMEMLKRKAVIQAEHARETAVSAAWWIVASAVLSAGAAILGSIV